MQSGKIACFWIMFPIMIKYDGKAEFCLGLPIPTKLSKLDHYMYTFFSVSWQIFLLKSVQTKTIISDARFKNVNLTIKHLTKDLILSMLTTDLLFFHFMSDRAKKQFGKGNNRKLNKAWLSTGLLWLSLHRSYDM